MCASVNVNLLNIFRLELKLKQIQYEGNIVGDIIDQFELDYINALPDYLKTEDKEHLNDNIMVLVNGANIKTLNDRDTELSDGDEIHLSVPIFGG